MPDAGQLSHVEQDESAARVERVLILREHRECRKKCVAGIGGLDNHGWSGFRRGVGLALKRGRRGLSLLNRGCMSRGGLGS